MIPINELKEAPKIEIIWYGRTNEDISSFWVNDEEISWEEFDKWYSTGMKELGWEPILALL